MKDLKPKTVQNVVNLICMSSDEETEEDSVEEEVGHLAMDQIE